MKSLKEDLSKYLTRVNMIKFFVLLGIFPLILSFIIFATSNILFFIGKPISRYHFIFSLILTLVSMFFLFKKNFKSNYVKGFVLFLIFIAVFFGAALKVSGHYYDISVDGQSYHQEAIIQLASGWNPTKEMLDVNDNPVEKNNIWINHYPKFSWIISASLFKITNHIELSKVFQLLFMLSAFCLTFAVILKLTKVKLYIASLIALLVAFNPVSAVQYLSFYIDGELGCLITCLVATLLLYIKDRQKIYLVISAFVTCEIINMKFTGIGYAAVLIAGSIMYFIFKKNFKQSIKLSLFFLSVAIISIAFFGYNTYVTNTISKGHPLYPVGGKDAIDFITPNTPGGFRNKNVVKNLIVSSFAKTDNLSSIDDSAKLKFPLSVSTEELNILVNSDNRIGGFGPLFSAILVSSSSVFILSFIKNRKKAIIAIAICAVIFISVIINPESWWARYVPQFWLIPIILLTLGYTYKNKWISFFSLLTLIFMSINVFIMFSVYTNNNDKSREYVGRIVDKLKTKTGPTKVYFGDYASNRERLKEAGVDYILVREMDQLGCGENEKALAQLPTYCAPAPTLTPVLQP